MNNITDIELGWLAGILEGEGSFVLGTTPKGYPRYEVTVSMTDEDVINELLRITGMGRIYGPYKKKKVQWKPSWKWSVVKEADVKDLCLRVKPLMYRRRRLQINRLLTVLYQRRNERQIPKLIYEHYGKYRVIVKGRRLGTHDTYEDAREVRDRELRRLSGQAS